MGNPSSVDQIAKIKSILYLSLLQLIPTKVYLLWGSNLNFRAKNEVCDFSTFLGFLSNKNFLFSFACITKEKNASQNISYSFAEKNFVWWSYVLLSNARLSKKDLWLECIQNCVICWITWQKFYKDNSSRIQQSWTKKYTHCYKLSFFVQTF